MSAILDSLGNAGITRTPLDANAVNFSLKLSVATALRFGELSPHELRPDILLAEEGNIRRIANKINVVHDWKQTINMISASPVGVAMFSQLTIKQWRKLISHSKAMKGTDKVSGKSVNTTSSILSSLPQLVRLLMKSRRTRITSNNLSTSTLKMLQSARVSIVTKTFEGTEMVEIPIGDRKSVV